MFSIDLNCDMGESFGNYKLGLDEEAAKYISSANVACGFHAADPVVMQKTVRLLKQNNVKIGAHPGFPDLLGFGRRNMNVSAEEAKAYIKYQIGALSAFTAAEGLRLQHVKPHGAMYNMAGKNYELARAICEGIYEVDSKLFVLGQSGSMLLKAAEDVGLRSANEVFADRAYEEDGSLVPRSKPGSMITNEDEAVNRVLSMVKRGRVTAITGKEIEVKADSVCVHGDGAKAIEFIKKIKNAFESESIVVTPFGEKL